MKIAYFITPHGFGHASRAAAVMEAISQRNEDAYFHIYTSVPEWFFTQSLSAAFAYHELRSDIGMIQTTPMLADLDATVDALNRMLPFDSTLVSRLAYEVQELGCRAVLCDIAPLGIVVAQQAGVPSVLIENFTWDWIYEEFAEDAPRLKPHIHYLDQIFCSADIHIQSAPRCRKNDAGWLCPPISRQIRSSKHELRQQLEIPKNRKLIIITMGGVLDNCHFKEQLRHKNHLQFVVPGGGQQIHREDNIVLLPQNSRFFHPDLINAADAVVGKAGYSTVTEVYYAGVPFGYVPRPHFRETKYLADYLDNYLPSAPISPEDYYSGDWLSSMDELLTLEISPPDHPNGAEIAADYICNRI